MFGSVSAVRDASRQCYRQTTAEPSYKAAVASTSGENSSAEQSSSSVRVRMKRTKMPVRTPAAAPSSTDGEEASFASDTSKTSTTTTSNTTNKHCDFTSMLTNAPTLKTAPPTSPITRHFKNMSYVKANDIVFGELDGIECAFYHARLGYLRFRPQQIKPFTVDSIYNLRFLAVIGQFKVISGNKTIYFGRGDLAVILKGSRYAITNTTDDVAVLIVNKEVAPTKMD